MFRFHPVSRLLPMLVAIALPGTAGAQDPGVASRRGMVVSAYHLASDVGAQVLHQGGNAVDAAVATAFALAVTYPTAGNIGGGGFMVIRLANGRETTIDYRERAPLRSTKTMYLDSTGAIRRELIVEGYLGAGVPGTVRGLALAHQKYGHLPWKALVLPAVELAERGFSISGADADGLNWLIEQTKGKYPATVASYGKPDGSPWKAGDRLRLPTLARTLRAIATQGPDAFYRGWIADSVALAMQRHGGIITKEDLAQYRAVERAPVKGHLLGYDIVTMPPPSSGGIAMVEMLNTLERLGIDRHPRFAPETLHLILETMRRAYLDRAEFLGDPDFATVPVERLTSPAHAAELAGSIDTAQATSSLSLAAGRLPVTVVESEHTTHFSVLDAKGNAVSNTYTLEAGYGSRVVVPGAGFLLNNEMGDFNKQPGITNTIGDIGTDANLIAPGKRMLSSMTPTIVTKGGRTVLITGSPGGRTIINTVLQVVLNVTAFGMTVRDAVDAPRIHHQWMPDVALIERAGVPDSTVDELVRRGHRVVRIDRQGDAHSIWIDPATGIGYGANDRRSPDSKASP